MFWRVSIRYSLYGEICDLAISDDSYSILGKPPRYPILHASLIEFMNDTVDMVVYTSHIFSSYRLTEYFHSIV
jgi:hypothetical protein